MEIMVERTVSLGHRLPSYNGICSSPHGHNVRVEAAIGVAGFFDFKVLDHMLEERLADLDHAMVLWVDDPYAATLRMEWPEFRRVELSVEPTTEALAQLVFNELRATGLNVLRVTVHETAKYQATATLPDPRVRRVT